MGMAFSPLSTSLPEMEKITSCKTLDFPLYLFLRGLVCVDLESMTF